MSYREQAQPTNVIVAHALHPLVEGVYPGDVFASSLDIVAEEFKLLSGEATIFAPGSRHRIGAINDRQSLSDAAIEYLVDNKEIPRARIRGGHALNGLVEGGVYCGADEVTAVSRSITVSEIIVHGLTAVCSPLQVRRLAIHYEGNQLRQSNGSPVSFCTPKIVDGDTLHAGIAEQLLITYSRVDPTWKHSLFKDRLRSSRMPNDGQSTESLTTEQSL